MLAKFLLVYDNIEGDKAMVSIYKWCGEYAGWDYLEWQFLGRGWTTIQRPINYRTSAITLWKKVWDERGEEEESVL